MSLSFAAAAAGWGAAALLLPAIILLHLLHRQQRQQTVPSTYLWQRVSQRLTRRTYWRRLLTSLLFWLQILSACLIAFALARPAWRGGGASPPPVWQIILDESASMLARDEGGLTRLQLAHRRLDQLAEQSPAGIRWQLLTASAVPQLIADGVDPRTASAPRLWRLRPASHGPADWLATARLAAAIRPAAATQVVLITDGSLPATVLADLAKQTGLPVQVELARSAAAPSMAAPPNVGITRFELAPVGDSVSQYQALITLFNSGPEAAPYTLSWQMDGQPLTSAPPIQGWLAPTAEASVRARLALLPGVVVSVHLQGNPDDALALDNQAYQVTLPPRRAHLLLVSPGNPALVHGLSIFPYVDLTMVPAAPPSVTQAAPYDLLLFDRVAPSHRPSVPWAVWGVPARALTPALPPLQAGFWSQWMARNPTLAASPIRPITRDWDEDHPLSRYIPWDQIRVNQAWPLPTLMGGLTLWQSQAGPLVQVGADPPGYLIVAFDLMQTDWPRHYSFPIWLKNVLDWAAPWASVAVGPSLTVGEPVPARSLPRRLFLPPEASDGTSSQPWQAAATPPARITPVARASSRSRPGPTESASGTPELLIVGPAGYRQRLLPRPAGLAAAAAATAAALWSAPLRAPLGGYWLKQGDQVVSGWSVNLLSGQETDLRLTLTRQAIEAVAHRPISARAAPPARSPAPLIRSLQVPTLGMLLLALALEGAVFIGESRRVRPRRPLPASRWWSGKGASGA